MFRIYNNVLQISQLRARIVISIAVLSLSPFRVYRQCVKPQLSKTIVLPILNESCIRICGLKMVAVVIVLVLCDKASCIGELCYKVAPTTATAKARVVLVFRNQLVLVSAVRTRFKVN